MGETNETHPSPFDNMLRTGFFRSLARAVCLLVSLLLSGCVPFTDGATRLAYDLEMGARKLRGLNQESLEVTHKPRSVPDGVKGPYQIELQESLKHPAAGGSLLVGDLESHNFGNWGYNWSTTYHLNFVRVPNHLIIRKAKAEPTILLLQKATGGSIDVVSIH
jgi:hypothetical protein